MGINPSTIPDSRGSTIFYIKYKMKVKGFLIFVNILQKDNTLYLFEISKLIEFY